MKNEYFAIAAAVLVFLFATSGIHDVRAQVTGPTLSNSTVSDILNQFNPVNPPIAIAPYASPSGCPVTQDSNNTVNKIQCGLYASDPLNNQTATQEQLQANSTYWFYGGDAPAENAPYSYYEDPQGLHIGVQAPSNGTYAGFYAVTPSTNAQLFHAVLTAPVSTLPYGEFQNGLYVQTTQAPVNYVTCVSITDNLGTVWAVVHTYGSPFGSLVFDTLWADYDANQPLTRDCTIITNGNNYLKVYLDGQMVYSSNALALGMPAPFYAFLEPQTSYDGQELMGTYNDFYSALSENVKVMNNPSSASVAKIIDGSGNVLASAPVLLGNASINIAKYHLPQNATVQIFDSNDVPIASSSLQTVYGGDVYNVTTGNNKNGLVP